jgi:pentatricopeptide repeat protein
MATRNVVSWGSMIFGLVKCGQAQKGLDLFQQMQQEGVEPNPVTFVGVLNACAMLGALEEGKHVHEQIVRCGFESNVFVGSTLTCMYAKCGSIEDARRVFNKMPTHNVVAWNAMISGHLRCGQGHKALELFQQMQYEGMMPDRFTFVQVLNACASLQALEEGRRIHTQIIQSGCELDVYVANGLIDMYAKCKSIQDAQKVFDRMPIRDVFAWNAMILGHVKCGQGQKALALSHRMKQEQVEPDAVTFVGVLNACASLMALEEGSHVHQEIIQGGFDSNEFVVSSLVDMYAKCGNLENAWKVLNKMATTTHSAVVWNAMIWGHVKCGLGQKALEVFQQMQREGVEPDAVTFVGVLNACASVGALDEGRQIEEQIMQLGFEYEDFVGNSLIDMYAKCGSIEDAWRVFNRMPMHDVVAWNALILGHVKCGQGHKALELFQQMQQECVEPDKVTFMGVVNACASVAALEEGRHVEQQIIQCGCDSDDFVGSSLIDMYAKCGSIEDACRVFNKMPTCDIVSWNAMLQGYAMHGHANKALEHFEEMCKEGVHIDNVSFLSLLSACNHAGLVNEGLHYFESLSLVCGVSATVEHYASMVDLLGRAGCLDMAQDLVKDMPCEPNSIVWKALLGACRIHGNVEMGEHIAKQALKVDPGNAAGYVLPSNIDAAAGEWDSSVNVH